MAKKALSYLKDISGLHMLTCADIPQLPKEWVKLLKLREFLCTGFEMLLKLGGAGAELIRARIT